VADPFLATFPPVPGGGLDHVKNLKYAIAAPTLDEESYQRCEYKGRGRTYGTELHPFGPEAVTNDQDDIRLATPGFNTIDFGTFVVADFFLTNTGIWALYERLPFGRQGPDFYNDYFAFTSAKRIGDRSIATKHNLAIEYDRKLGEIRWFVNNNLVMKVDKIGFAGTDPELKLLLDHGGTPEVVDPIGFNCGWGLFTLLDLADPLNPDEDLGLAKIDTTPDWYFYPTNFVDEDSEVSSRLFGQGAEIELDRFSIEIKTA